MIAFLLVALGIPLGLVLGVLGVGLWSRRSFRRSPDVFAVKTRSAGAEPPRWSRRAEYARWVHDVLVVHQGLALVRNHVLGVITASELARSSAVVGLGDDPVGVRLGLDDGSFIDVASSRSDGDALIGPIRDRLEEVRA